MKRLVIWAHSTCRSNASLFAAVGRLAEARGMSVSMCLWDRMPMDDDRKDLHAFEAVRIGDDLKKGRDILRQTGGGECVHVFCVYQNSSAWRQLIVEAKASGARVVVNAESPCEMCLGAKAMLKRLYYRWVLPMRVGKAVRAADLFLNASGDAGRDRLQRLGWPKWKILPFGYASPPLAPSLDGLAAKVWPVEALPPTRNADEPLKILHLGSEAPYRGVAVLDRAVRLARASGADIDLRKTGGRLRPAELLDAIRKADLVVGCGLCEPWGMRINDALLEGVPAIVSDGMGVRWAVERYGCGVVVPKGDAKALAQVLLRAWGDAEFLQRLRSGAFNAAHELLPEVRAREWLKAVCGFGNVDG